MVMTSLTDNRCCSFLHAFYEDDWTRCPYPEQVRRYRRTFGQATDIAWYCDEGAAEARLAGIQLEELPDNGGAGNG